MNLRADPTVPAEGTVLEARLSKGLGVVTTVVLEKGTLRKGDLLIAGSSYGKVRKLMNDQGKEINEAGPSIPVQVTDWFSTIYKSSVRTLLF
jgi:translation initiation factor IF-2